MTLSTNELIRRYQAGQSDLFEALFDRYKDYVYRVAFGLTRHVEESEEVVQEAFLDVLKALPRYDVEGTARFETWLYRVTVNRCKMRWRRKRLPSADWDEVGEQIVQVPDTSAESDPERVAQEAEQRRTLWQAVGTLQEIYRQVILLRYEQGLSYDEIAQHVGISMGTVKSRLNAAHKKLQALVDDETRGGGNGGPWRGIIALLVWALGLGVCHPCTPGTAPRMRGRCGVRRKCSRVFLSGIQCQSPGSPPTDRGDDRLVDRHSRGLLSGIHRALGFASLNPAYEY